MTSLQDILIRLSELADTGGSTKLSVLDLLNITDGPPPQCKTALTHTEMKPQSGNGTDHMRRFGLHALKWSFGSREADEIIVEIERYKMNSKLALTN